MFKDLRKKSGFTQVALAEKLGIAQNTVSCWETGVSKPDVLTVVKIAEIFNCDISEIIKCFVSEKTETA